jgi:UPF0755 protein
MKKRALQILLLLFLIVVTVTGWSIYRLFLLPNVSVADGSYELLIADDAGFEAVCDSLESKGAVVNMNTFKRVSQLRKYTENIKPGRYLLNDGMSNNELVVMLRAGLQVPVRVTFNNIRTLYELAGKVGGQIQADSASIITFLTDESNYRDDGFTWETVLAIFIPDTYEFYWNVDAGDFYERMLKEYNGFWNKDRTAQAEGKGLTPIGVSIIASIVDDEVARNEEKSMIAGVYLNRLRLGMPLQACPTLKFALNDFTITRVLTEHTKVDSPYNTYKYRGLPPGPVRCATRSGLEAVLNAQKHDYIFFAAKADFSGYHNFSRSLSEHNRYAAEYHRELNRRKIYK